MSSGFPHPEQGVLERPPIKRTPKGNVARKVDVPESSWPGCLSSSETARADWASSPARTAAEGRAFVTAYGQV